MMLTRWKFLAMTVLSHACLLALLLYGSAAEFAAAFILFVFLGLLSTAFYHRLLSHRSWSPTAFVKYLGVFIGIFSLTGTPVTRTAVHRQHHAHADDEKDPHSPAHQSILHMYFPQLKDQTLNLRLVKDILADRPLMLMHKYYLHVILAAALIFPLNWVMVWGAAAALLWANIFMCNWLCHRDGVIRDHGVWSLFTFGEGHHALHHANPTAPRFGRFDPAYPMIRLLHDAQ